MKIETMELELAKGKLIVSKNPDDTYPGFAVLYQTEDGDEIDLAVIENPNKGKQINVYTYSDITREDYTNKFSIDIDAAERAISGTFLLTKLVENTPYKELICNSFDEAINNDRRKNIVIIDDSEIYLTYKKDGMFGELLSWGYDEIAELLDNGEETEPLKCIADWIHKLYKHECDFLDARLNEGVYPVMFTPYEAGEVKNPKEMEELLNAGTGMSIEEIRDLERD